MYKPMLTDAFLKARKQQFWTPETARVAARRGVAVRKAQAIERVQDRFWAKVDKDGPVIRVELGPCWIYTGYTDPVSGYGYFWYLDNNRPAHRVAWQLEHGPISSGVLILHQCDNPPCVRHLYAGTVADNQADMDTRQRRATGIKHGQSILNEHVVRAIRSEHAAGGTSYKKLGAIFGVDRTTIAQVITRRTWKQVGV